LSVPNNLTATDSSKKSPKIKDPRDYELALQIALGKKYQEAGRIAGFAESTLKTGYFYKKCKSPYISTLIDHIADSYPDKRRQMAKVRLARAVEIENNIYEKAEQDTEFAINPTVAKTLERDYKLAGLLHDFSPSQVLVPIQVAIQIQTHIEDQQAKSPQITLDADDNE